MNVTNGFTSMEQIYLTYASPVLYSGERMQEREFALMKSYFPNMRQSG